MVNKRLEELKRKCKNGEISIGTAMWLTDSAVTEHLGSLGFDYVWIDAEHSVYTLEHIRTHIMAAELTGMATFIRAIDHNPSNAKSILELAPDAIIFPMVNTAEQARAVIDACLYHPKGTRGYGPSRANRFGMIPNDEYAADAEKCFWKIIQIEHIEAVRNLEEILSVEGVDAILVGPNDLSISMGLFCQFKHPDVLKALDEIAEKCLKHKIPFGVSIGYDEEKINDWKCRGATLMTVGMDYIFMDTGAKIALNGTKQICRGE